MSGRRATPHFRTERISAGVYAAIADPAGFALCNSGIVDLGGASLVFDSMLTPMAAAHLRRDARRVTGHDPTWVVNSHWHGDHIWGNSAFPESHIVSTRRVRREILRRSRSQFDDCRRSFPKELALLEDPETAIPANEVPRLRAWFQGVLETPANHRIVPPDVTFEEVLELEGSRRSIQLITYGGGHSPSDVFAYLSEERIIFAGDLAMVGLHPSLSDGWPDRWRLILRRMARLGVDRVVPGHGPVAPGKTLRTVETYLADVSRIASRELRRGVRLRDLKDYPIPERYSGWQFTIMFPGNLARAYQLAKSSSGPADTT
ncbi:MAG: MBL fold metallo-hydrolase [Thermoplasmata archaeon]